MLGLLFATIVPAQNLPSLPQAGNIRHGSLASGREYYLVTNKTEQGLADFAFVSDGEADITLMDDLQHFQGIKPWQMLSRRGASISRGGWLSLKGDGSVFRFNGIDLGNKPLKDSTFLLIFDLMAKVPGRQAVIVSGDIDAASLIKDMEIFSMMLPPVGGSASSGDYSWTSVREPQVSIVETPGPSSVTVSFRAPRTAPQYMATALPHISRMYASGLGEIVSRRVAKSLSDRKIQFADVAWDYLGSADSGSEEIWSVTVSLAPEHLLDASRTVAAVLSTINSEGVGLEEFTDARNVYSSLMDTQGAETMLLNGYWVDRCVAAFLRGADLAAPSYISKYFASRTMADTTSLRLFESYSKALIDRDRDLGLRFRTDTARFSAANALAEFRYAFDNPGDIGKRYTSGGRDTLGLNSHVSRVRIKTEQEDPLSGGMLWTVSNGMKVVWRRMDTPGLVRWGFMVKGGYTLVPGFNPGEGAFMSDMLWLYSVGGLKASDFRTMLESNGIIFEPKVSLTDLRISGSAPSAKLGLLLSVLVSLANERTPDEAAFEYYRQNERLRLGGDLPVKDRLYGILRPDDGYSPAKRAECLSDDLQERAEQYFESRFSRCDEGVLVLVGDVSESSLRKVLGRNLGNFRTGASRTRLPRISRTEIAGNVTYTAEGEQQGIYSLISLALPYTGENRIAAYMASVILRRRLAAAMVPWGLVVSGTTEVSAYPEERFMLYLSAERAPEGSVPDELRQGNMTSALQAWVRTIGEAGETAPSDAVLKVFKNSLESEISQELNDPEAIVEAVMIRYADGKDVVTKYKEKIKAVSPDGVKRILHGFSTAPRVDYIVK